MVNRCPTARIPGPYFVRQAPVWRVRDGDNVTFATVPVRCSIKPPCFSYVRPGNESITVCFSTCLDHAS
ncbi:unnamed protein product [Phaeothamnion confervicola]